MRKMEHSVVMRVGQGKKSGSLTGIEPMTIHGLDTLTTELLGDSWRARSYTQFVVTRVLHTARINNVKSTMCDNKERKMAILSSERKEKDGIFSCYERGTKKKSESPVGMKPNDL